MSKLREQKVNKLNGNDNDGYIDSESQLYSINCKYKKYGCNVTLNYNDTTKHEREYELKHILMRMDYNENILQNEIKNLKSQVNILKTELKSVKDESSKKIRKLQINVKLIQNKPSINIIYYDYVNKAVLFDIKYQTQTQGKYVNVYWCELSTDVNNKLYRNEIDSEFDFDDVKIQWNKVITSCNLKQNGKQPFRLVGINCNKNYAIKCEVEYQYGTTKFSHTKIVRSDDYFPCILYKYTKTRFYIYIFNILIYYIFRVQ